MGGDDVGGDICDDALTISEFCAMFNCHRAAAQARVDKMVDSGRAKRVRKRVPRSDGAMMLVTAYRLVDHAATTKDRA